MKKIAIAAALLAAGVAQAQTGNSAFYAEGGYQFTNIDYFGPKADVGAVRGVLGWDLHPNVAAELMVNVGAGDDSIGNLGAKVKLKSATGVFFKPKYALNDQFEVFGRLGWASVKLKFSNATASAEDKGNDFAWGLGASYKFNKQWYGSVDYTNFYDKDSAKVSGVALSVGYRF